jgi:hypothetical protein
MRPTRDLLDLLLTLDSSVEIRISHGVWLEEGYPIRSEYRERVHTAFGARVENVNFGDPAAAAVVNQWVDDATHGRIREFVSPADLDLAATASGPFVRSDGSTVSVPMMRQTLDAQFVNDAGAMAGVARRSSASAWRCLATPFRVDLFQVTQRRAHRDGDGCRLRSRSG